MADLFRTKQGQTISGSDPNIKAFQKAGATKITNTSEVVNTSDDNITLPRIDATAVKSNITTPSGAIVDSTTGKVIKAPPKPDMTASSVSNQPTPETIAPPAEKTELQKLQEQFLQTITPSTEEQETSSALSDILTSKELGVEKVRGKAIAKPFLQGQAAAIERQAGLQAAPLQRQLALLQQQRGLEGQRAEAELGFAQPSEADKPVTVGAGQRLVDPRTGEVIFEAQSEEKTRPLSIKEARDLGVPIGTTMEDLQGIIPQGASPEDFEIRTVGNTVIRINKNTSETETIFQGEAEDDPFTTQQKFSNTLAFRKSYLSESGDFKLVRDSFGRIKAAVEDPSAAGDLALIFNFMKMLDPGSVVRESEFATAENAASVPDRIRNIWNKILTGQKLGLDQRADFINQAGNLFNSQLTTQRTRQEENRKTAESLGLDPELAIPDLTGDTSEISSGSSQVDFSSLGSNIQAALDGNFSNGQIVSKLMEDPNIKSVIEEARSNNFSDDDIINFLLNQ